MQASAAGRRMEAGFDQRAPGLDRADDVLRVETAGGAEGDPRRRRILPVALLDRRLERHQPAAVHCQTATGTSAVEGSMTCAIWVTLFAGKPPHRACS